MARLRRFQIVQRERSDHARVSFLEAAADENFSLGAGAARYPGGTGLVLVAAGR